MLFDVMKSAFQDELEKIAVSQGWVAKKVLSAGTHSSPERMEEFGKRMLDMKAKGWKTGRRSTIENAVAAKKAADKSPMPKTAGELQGHVRGGRRPLSATTLLDKEKDTKGERKKLADLTKTSGKAGIAAKLTPDAKTLGLLGIGAYGLHKVQQVKRRHDIGLQMEMQQRQGMGF